MLPAVLRRLAGPRPGARCGVPAGGGARRAAASSTEAACARDLRRGAIFLNKGVYCEVRSLQPAGHGRSAKARELRLADADEVRVVECERAQATVLYKDEASGRLVVAGPDYDEVEVPLSQLGEAANCLDAGSQVSLLTHEGHVVKVVPPPAVADELRLKYRKERRAELAERQVAR